MPIVLNWEDDARTILRHTYRGKWTVAEFYEAVDGSRSLLLDVAHPVDLIIDMREGPNPPKGITPAYQYADRKVPANQRLIVMVNPSEYMRRFNRIVEGVAPRASKDRHVVETVEDAHNLIQELRLQLEENENF